jgi:hypothetical protein
VSALLVACLASGCTSASITSVAPSGSKCHVAAEASPVQFASSGGRGTLTVRAERDCGWTVAPQEGWLSLTGERSGHGDATLSYTVASNPRPAARAGDLLVEGTRLQVTQAGAPCTFRLSRAGEAVGAAGGTITFSVETLEGCSWSTSTDATWLNVVNGATGTASAVIEVRVDANGGAARSGGVRVATETFAIAQAAAPTSSPSPAPSPTPSPTPSPSPSPDPSPSPSPTPIALQGQVTGLSGSCPAVRFVVDGRTVLTTGSTSFDRRCRDLDDGDTVRVSGMTQADGTIDASEVEITRNAR